MKIARNIAKVAVVAFGLLLPLGTALTVLTAPPAAACGVTVEECNRNAIGVPFKGNQKIPDPIRVEVCHGYWNQLDVGTYRGQKTRWWGPVMVYNAWYGDLPIATKECKTYWVRPGTELRLFASCVDRVISTGVMNRPGRYIMS